LPCTQSFTGGAGQRTHNLGELLDQAYPDLMFPLFTPLRAKLEHKSTALFLTDGDNSSTVEALYHGYQVLTLGFSLNQLSIRDCSRSAGVGLSLDKLRNTSFGICDSIALIVDDQDGRFAQDFKRMKEIARIASRRKHLAADLIEQSMIDEEYQFLNGKEMHPRSANG
jgi:hypothetical protein